MTRLMTQRVQWMVSIVATGACWVAAESDPIAFARNGLLVLGVGAGLIVLMAAAILALKRLGRDL